MPDPLGRAAIRALKLGHSVVEDCFSSWNDGPWEVAAPRILVARLSDFRDVERSAPHAFLHAEAKRAFPGCYVDFSFFPPRSDRESLEKAGAAPWFGLASGRSVADFDIVLVSNSFGLELVNLAWLVARSGIPPRASLRGEGDPLVLLGGSNAMASQAVLFPAAGGVHDALVDGVFFGEGEGRVAELLRTLAGPGSRRERLDSAMAAVAGFWAAGRPLDGVAQAVFRGPDPAPFIPPPRFNGDEAATVRLQIARGCPEFCSFCFEGWERKPYREKPLAEILAEGKMLREATGAELVELYGFNFNTHSSIARAIAGLAAIFPRVNFMSQRIDSLEAGRGLLGFEAAAGKRSFTLGVEGVSARLRAYYSKGLPEGVLETLLGRMARLGPREIKFFYIISGLESEGDLAEFARFAAFASELFRGRGARLVYSFGYLVRMPFTPLGEPGPLPPEGAMEAAAASMKSVVEGSGAEFRLASEMDERDATQFLASAPASAPLLLDCASRGATYDLRLSRQAIDAFGKALLAADPAANPYSAIAAATGVHERKKRRMLADAFRELESCFGREGKDASCSGCGACDEGEREFLLGHRAEAIGAGDIERMGRIMEDKARAPHIVCAATMPRALAGASEAYLSAWATRTLLARHPGLSGCLLGAKELLRPILAVPDGLPWSGAALFALKAADPQALIAALREARGFTHIDGIGQDDVKKLLTSTATDIEVAIGVKEADRTISAWLASCSLACTRRALPGGYAYEVSPKDSRKRLASLVRFEGREGGILIRVEGGGKCRPGELAGSFGGALLSCVLARAAIGDLAVLDGAVTRV